MSHSSTSKARIMQTDGVFQMGPSSHLLIQGGEFTQIIHDPNFHANEAAFTQLQAHVATTAYATQQEGDAPKCHPNTRTVILKVIIDWVLVATTGIQWILWINGAAGAGKSAIARSITDLCLKRQIVIARFFFFRTDSTRNTIKPVVSTLVYQLIKSIPALKSKIIAAIHSDPLIFNESLETQFKTLIFEPLRQLHKESPLQKPIVFLLDGIDECSGNNNQANVIHTISQFVAEKSVPLIAIFASRTESQLKMAFNEPEVDKILRRLPLDTDYRADDDIQLFLDDSFTKIKKIHPFRSSIDAEWPSPSLIQEIVDKSSNQFIYASVVMKFLSSPHLHPVQQLEIVRGLRPAGELTPFAQLDALYQHIFSQVHDITRATEILAVAILSNFSQKWKISNVLNIAIEDIDIALEDLTSVVSYTDEVITFLHASLPEFLLDQSRAQQYYINKTLWRQQLAIKYLSKGRGYLEILHAYLSQDICTPQLQNALFKFYPSDYDWVHPQNGFEYIHIVRNMDFGDGGKLYRHQLNLVVCHVHECWPNEIYSLGEKHEIKKILDQIEYEKTAARKTDVPVEEETSPKTINSSRKGSDKASFKSRLPRRISRK